MENSYDEIFDKHIRAKLDNLDVPGAPEGWSSLFQKMEADPDLSPADSTNSEVDPFDELIKSKLQTGQATYNPSFWSLMENRIEADMELSGFCFG